MSERKTFRTCLNKGFHVKFPNGLILSTQSGWANYCENYDKPMPDRNKFPEDEMSNDAEIAIIAPDGEFITSQFKNRGDEVLGRIRIDEWLEAVDFCRNWKPVAPASRL